MSNYVPNYEDRYYEVHPRNLGWAMHELGNIPGYNVQGYAPGKGGMYIIVVQVPAGAAQADWRAQSTRRRRVLFDISPRMVALLALVVLLACSVGYAVYSGVSVPTWDEVAQHMPAVPEPIAKMFTPPAPHGEPVVERTGWHWPWESSVVSKPQPKQDGFRWPWDDAAKQVSDTVDMVKNVTLFVGVLLLLGVVLWFVAKVRGALGK